MILIYTLLQRQQYFCTPPPQAVSQYSAATKHLAGVKRGEEPAKMTQSFITGLQLSKQSKIQREKNVAAVRRRMSQVSKTS